VQPLLHWKAKILLILAIIFLVWIVDKITVNIKNSNNNDKHKDKSPLYYMSQLFTDTLPAVKFRNTSTQQMKKKINSLNTKKNSNGCDGISTKILKISSRYTSSPLNTNVTKYSDWILPITSKIFWDETTLKKKKVW
jgi:hypothetical protein